MTFRHVTSSYCVWLWGRWTRLSAFLVTACVIVSLTIGMTRATQRYNALCDRMQAIFRRHDAARPTESTFKEVVGREHDELIHKLDEILARLPAAAETSATTQGPLSSSH